MKILAPREFHNDSKGRRILFAVVATDRCLVRSVVDADDKERLMGIGGGTLRVRLRVDVHLNLAQLGVLT